MQIFETTSHQIGYKKSFLVFSMASPVQCLFVGPPKVTFFLLRHHNVPLTRMYMCVHKNVGTGRHFSIGSVSTIAKSYLALLTRYSDRVLCQYDSHICRLGGFLWDRSATYNRTWVASKFSNSRAKIVYFVLLRTVTACNHFVLSYLLFIVNISI